MRHLIFHIPIDDISAAELDRLLNEWVNGNEQKFVTTPNPEFVLLAQKDEVFKSLLQSSDLSLPDGVGLRFATAALTDDLLHHRQTGVDLVEQLVRIGYEQNKPVLFVGGDPGTAEATRQIFLKKYPGVDLSVYNPGLIKLSDPAGLSTMNANQPCILLVALGQKKQEQFIKHVFPLLPTVRVAVGIGGAFDMLSGRKPRAPYWMQKIGIEWVWRLVIEPQRFGRIFRASIIFPLVVVSATLKQHRFLRACQNVFPEIYRQIRGL